MQNFNTVLHKDKVFGLPLEIVTKQQPGPNGIPLLIEKVLEFLSEPKRLKIEGLFRLSPPASKLNKKKNTLPNKFIGNYFKIR